MAGVFENRAHGLFEEQFGRPRFRPRRRIVNGELIADRVVVGAGEAFDQMHLLAGSLEDRLLREVRAIDDQCVAFPPAAITSDPLVNVGW